MTTCTW